MRIAQMLDSVSVCVFDLDGTLAEGIPYEEVLKGVAGHADVPFKKLMARYLQNWQGLEEAQAYHEGLAIGRTAEVRDLYAAFAHAKSHPTVLAGAVEVLERCRLAGKQLICWTRGKEELQRNVLRSTALDKHFDVTIVTPQKTEQTVRELLLPTLSGRKFAMIGDSYDQDLAPVKAVAALRVWISGSKANGYGTAPAHVNDDVIVIKQIGDLLQ